MPFIRSISGLRATLGDSLTPEIVSAYTHGFAQSMPEGKIIVGRDGRPSGVWIEKIVTEILSGCGREVMLLGMVPTPTVQFMVEREKAAGGIIITASHNPEQWNGLKFLNAEGIFLNKEENEKLWNIVDNCSDSFSAPKEAAETEYFNEAIDLHINSILDLALFRETNIIGILQSKNLKIVVDAVNSSGSVAINSLLAKLGTYCIPLYCDGTGLFPHTPEPLPVNLGDLANAVKEHHADLGIAVDPDADRLVLIDEKGNPIGEEKTIALATMSVLMNKKYFSPSGSASLVVNYSTTRLVEDVASMYGAEVHRSAVGEINVVGKMKETGAVIGGEGSGGVILPACHYGRDSLVGTALILTLLAQTGKTLSQICADLPDYKMIKFKKEFTGKLDNIILKIVEKYKGAKITLDDGIRIDFPKSWVQLRSSNTEPIIRIIAEALTLEEAQALVDEICGMI